MEIQKSTYFCVCQITSHLIYFVCPGLGVDNYQSLPDVEKEDEPLLRDQDGICPPVELCARASPMHDYIRLYIRLKLRSKQFPPVCSRTRASHATFSSGLSLALIQSNASVSPF